MAAVGFYALGLAVVLGPYLAAAGAVAPRAAVTRILGRPGPEPRVPVPPPLDNLLARVWHLPNGQLMSFVAEDPTANLRRHGWGAVHKFARELTIVFWYWVGVLALLGLGRVWRRPGNSVDWFARVFVACYVFLALGFAVKEGYVSSRHLLPLVVVGIGCSGFGALVLGQTLARRFHFPRLSGVLPAGRLYAWGAGVVLLAAGACGWQTFKPLSPVGLGHRAAAHWLATTAGAAGTVLDTQGWMGLYSGRATHFYATGPAGFADPQLAYVVLERHELGRPSNRSRTLQQLLDVGGDLVRIFPGSLAERLNHDVLVYRWHPERLLRRASALCAAAPGSSLPSPPQEGYRDARAHTSLR
jgi:hypothetical protein